MAVLNSNDTYKEVKRYVLDCPTYRRTPIPIEAISQRTNASAIPVREALIRLAVEDVIDHEFGKGFYTKAIELNDILSNYELIHKILTWRIDCTLSHRARNEALVAWITSKGHYLEDASADFDSFDEVVHRCVSCFTCGQQSSVIINALSQTAAFRRSSHIFRSDVQRTASGILSVATLLVRGSINEARQLIDEWAHCRLTSIPTEFEMIVAEQVSRDLNVAPI